MYGDPAGLPAEYKRRLLKALVRSSNGQQRLWIDSSPDSLVRLADPALEDDISEIIRDRTVSAELRAEMLQLVRYGNLRGCLSAALAFPEESKQIKSYAVFVVRDAGDDQSRQRLAEIVQQMESIESRLCAWISSAPTALAPKCFCYFLKDP